MLNKHLIAGVKEDLNIFKAKLLTNAEYRIFTFSLVQLLEGDLFVVSGLESLLGSHSLA